MSPRKRLCTPARTPPDPRLCSKNLHAVNYTSKTGHVNTILQNHPISSAATDRAPCPVVQPCTSLSSTICAISIPPQQPRSLPIYNIIHVWCLSNKFSDFPEKYSAHPTFALLRPLPPFTTTETLKTALPLPQQPHPSTLTHCICKSPPPVVEYHLAANPATQTSASPEALDY